MPNGLTGTQQGIFWGLTYLYGLYRAGYMDRPEAVKRKRKLLSAFNQAESKAQFREKLLEQTERLWRSVGRYTTACRRDPTPENAIALCDAVNGFLRAMPEPVECRNGTASCPVCERQFTESQTQRHPHFCENCGAELDWRPKP